MTIEIKRIYDSPAKGDGLRILVDRLWPRGVSKNKAKIDLWLKDIAPGDALRKWFAHDPEKWTEFRRKYFKELDSKKELLDEIVARAKKNDVTLLYGAKDREFNNRPSAQTGVPCHDCNWRAASVMFSAAPSIKD